MDFIIRLVKFEDVEDINEMRRMDGVREIILFIISERIVDIEDFIKRLGFNDYVFVVEVIENGVKKVVGIVGFYVNSSLRLRYLVKVGIMVYRDY